MFSMQKLLDWRVIDVAVNPLNLLQGHQPSHLLWVRIVVDWTLITPSQNRCHIHNDTTRVILLDSPMPSTVQRPPRIYPILTLQNRRTAHNSERKHPIQTCVRAVCVCCWQPVSLLLTLLSMVMMQSKVGHSCCCVVASWKWNNSTKRRQL